MDIVVTVEGPQAADELRSLRTWLVDDDDFRGRVRPRDAVPAAGTLAGGVVDGLTIAVGALGTALATVLVTWSKTRVGQVRLRATRQDGAVVELAAEKVRGLNAEDAWRRVDQVAELLAAGQVPPGPATAAAEVAEEESGDPPGGERGDGRGDGPDDGSGERPGVGSDESTAADG